MSNKMLIDAAHPEETRVVVLRGNKVEEFDFEAANRQQLRGNIYLAKVTRVEPSLQAAFVEYGGNRHGFLAFSEIHPDYYQIPFADRQALIDQQAAEEAEARRAENEEEAAPKRRRGKRAAAAEAEAAPEASEPAVEDAEVEAEAEGGEEPDEAEAVESVGAEDALEEVPERRKPRPRQYKIQEVIKRRQVLLVQVVKEERGNKGAALTTYLSLAGRYSVLMPNTGRGGGISRKITNAADRKRLKEIASDLEVPEGMGVILRTAGANRTKTEIKRDFEYLLRLWENVRELTLRSSAPTLVYEEGSLIKRSIRDLYSREIDQVLVAGDDAYREAKDFMRMLTPSHAKNVQAYREPVPIFSRYGVESQLDAMFSPQVTLKSGGYIVLNQTEALVSIDVNSGRSTREHSIEDTALSTNLEAAEEIARQLRLRDLAGLIVIDFIDMEESRNNRSVERKLKECLRLDRARIQVGRISHFGLLEMSRQRIRTGVLESSSEPCSHCHGTGQVRSMSSLALQILRALEDYLIRSTGHNLLVRTRPDVALYVLNQKRSHLAELEARFGLSITVSGEGLPTGSGFVIERGAAVTERAERSGAVAMLDVAESLEEPAEEEEEAPKREEGRREGRPSRRRRRGDRPDRTEEAPSDEQVAEASGEEAEADEASEAAEEDETGANGQKRRRRGRRGGRRRGRGRENGHEAREDQAAEVSEDLAEPAAEGAEAAAAEPIPDSVEVSAEAPAAEPATASEDAAPAAEPESEASAAAAAEPVPAGDAHAEEIEALSEAAERHEESGSAPEAASDQDNERQAEPAETAADAEPAQPEPEPQPEDNRPKRTGWWSRRSFF
ncbi:Rne/Rng family ribonuclease [Propylenella binzhouense]|uniref:Ribonuclease E n=1 Tax=Propylenella binzhouense TaxID=2555902 RepID=A0A964T2N7_9HYPH|nr:ribonuclease E/G [Propylenella binzhouense]MYZ47184.1 ribonuclease E/G [Propylenella binzhouense]